MNNETNTDHNKNTHKLPSINNHIFATSAKVNVKSYIDTTGQKTPTGFDPATQNNVEHNLDHTEVTELIPLPHQEPLEDSSNEANLFMKKSGTTEKTSETYLEKPYQIPNSLRKKFKIPYGKTDAPIITPQSKVTRRSTLFDAILRNTNTSPKLDFFTKKTTDKHSAVTNDNIKNHLTTTREYETLNHDSSDNESNDSTLVNHKGSSNDDNHTTYKKHYQKSEIYTSRFLNSLFKPDKKSLGLTPELESLEELLLSQHEVLTNPIIALGSTNLTLTKTLENKKDSLQLLLQKEKIPRSLRIKCELTTSPQYDSHPDFLRLKNDLQHEVDNFICKGTDIMTEWSKINLQLLHYERCHNVLEKALKILEGLTSFHIDLFGTPLWPSVDDKHISLFLFKMYLSSTFVDTSEITEYFMFNSEQILLIGAKLLTNNPSDEETTKLISSLKLTDVDLNEDVDYLFVTETLLNFDQILRHTTIKLWQHYKENMKQLTAAQKFKAKMKSLDIINASTATAQAIAKATNTLEHNEAININTSLRISNLEKWKLKQEQQTNELSNRIKAQTSQKNIQKNSNGSHLKESMTSPEKMTPSTMLKRNNLKRSIVDLTLENSQEQHTSTSMFSPPQLLKKTHKTHRKNFGTKNQQTLTKKSVQWKDSVNTTTIPLKNQIKTTQTQPICNPFTLNQNDQPVPFFPPPPPPLSTTFGQHVQNPYHLQLQLNGTIPPYNHSLYPNPTHHNFQNILSNPSNLHNAQQNILNPFTGIRTQNNTHYSNPFAVPPNNKKF